MFLDLLDTIKTSENYQAADACRKNAVHGESMLYYLLLSGQTPTLTQTQVMDSNIIHNILRDEKSKAYFLNMLMTGNIKVALYTGNGSRSLQDYFKKTLTYGMNDNTSFFDYSTMPFLSQYDSKVRKSLNKNIIDAIEHNSYNFKTDGIKKEHTDYIGQLVEEIQDIDRAVRGRYLESSTYKKNIDSLFMSQCLAIINDESTDAEFYELCKRMLTKTGYNNRRSEYYKNIENMKNGYSVECIEKIKKVVDNCYNEAVASLIDNNGYNLNFTRQFVDLMKPIQKNREMVKNEIIEITPSKENRYLTWETLYNILTEVEALEKEKKLSRVDALNEYKRVQPFRPIIMVAKYFGISIITSALPGIPDVVEILSNIIMGTASDITSEKLKKPSFKEMLCSVKDSKTSSNIAENAVKFISMFMK